jgi:hypothetical protein
MMRKTVIILREGGECRVGKANGSRERAPDDNVPTKIRVSSHIGEKKGGRGATRLCPPYKPPALQPSEQQQNQQDHDDKAETAAAIVTRAVERSAANAAEAAKQCDNENNENNRSNRHNVSSSPTVGLCLLCLA